MTLSTLHNHYIYIGEALPHNSSAVSVSTGNSSCTSGQVTNVIVQGGGVAGERGPPGPQGERAYSTYHSINRLLIHFTIGLTGPAGPPGGGVVYTRWARSSCPNTHGTELVYAGGMVGSKYNELGGSSSYLCLHTQPQFLATTPGVQNGRGYLYATEYQARDGPPAFGNMLYHDAPCAVCYSSGRTATITIPGRTSCPSSWTREYYGYLMADKHIHNSRAPVCVDVSAESVPGSQTDYYASELYFLETRCPGLCPPYSNGAEVTCVVCSK